MNHPEERRVEHIRLERAELAHLLEPVLAGHSIAAAEILPGGFSNTNYRVRLAGSSEELVIKIYTRDPEAARKEYNAYRRVRERVPVAEVLYSDPAGWRYERPYTIFRWVPGVSLEEILAGGNGPEIEEAARSVGETLARLGSFRFEQAGFLGPDLTVREPQTDFQQGWLAYLESCLDQPLCHERLGAERAGRLRAFVRCNAARLEPVSRDRSLVHADFNPTNLLLRREAGGWQVAAVLDWEFVYSGSPLFDVANLFRHREQLPPEFETGFVRGFRQADGELATDWKRITRLLDLVNLLEFLTLDRPQPQRVASCKRLIATTLAEWSED